MGYYSEHPSNYWNLNELDLELNFDLMERQNGDEMEKVD